MASSSSTIKLERNFKRRRNIYRGSNVSTSDSGQMLSGNEMDTILIPATSNNSTNKVIDDSRTVTIGKNLLNMIQMKPQLIKSALIDYVKLLFRKFN